MPGKSVAVALTLLLGAMLIVAGCQEQRVADARDARPLYFVSGNISIGDQVNATIGLYHRLGETLNVTISGASGDERFAFRLINVDGTYNDPGSPMRYPVRGELWTYPRVNVAVAGTPIPPGSYSINLTIDFADGYRDTCRVPIEVVERIESGFWWLPVQS